MEAQITEIASNAGRVLLNPFLLTVPVVGVLALLTGFAARVAIFMEDLHSMHLVPRRRQPIHAAVLQANTQKENGDQ